MTLAGLSKRPGYAAYHNIWKAIDWLFPPLCGGCGKPGARYCKQCLSETIFTDPNVCKHCGSPVIPDHSCYVCLDHPPICEQLHSWGVYQGSLRNAIHALKYQRDLGLAEYFARHLIETLLGKEWIFDLITAVPLSADRQRARGYNQSSLLARPVALAFKRPFSPHALYRNRVTHTQVGLNTKDRYQNVLGAFTARPEAVRGKIVLIMDDVTTTGATIQACGKALIESGAAAVYGLTLARTPLHLTQADEPDGGYY